MSSVPDRVLKQAKSRDFHPSVRIGKSGLTDTVIEEVINQLKSRELVKMNKGLFEREQRAEVWSYIANETKSTVVLQRGNIGVLWRS